MAHDGECADNQQMSLKGTLYWMAPEMMQGKDVGMPADIWSLGCLVVEMITAQAPWHDQLDKKLKNNMVCALCLLKRPIILIRLPFMIQWLLGSLLSFHSMLRVPLNQVYDSLLLVLMQQALMLCLVNVVRNMQMGIIYHIVNNDIQPAIPENLSKDGKEFLKLCFDRDPRRRANCNRLLEHPFVANVTTPASSHQVATHADVGNTFSPIHEESSGLATPPSNPPPSSIQASRPPSVSRFHGSSLLY